MDIGRINKILNYSKMIIKIQYNNNNKINLRIHPPIEKPQAIFGASGNR